MIKHLDVDPDVIEIISPKLEEWLGYADESKAPVVNRRIFDRLTIPDSDRNTPNSDLGNYFPSGKGEIDIISNLMNAAVRNSVVFKPHNIMMWHSNSGAPGHRAYFIYNEKPGSIFRYRDYITGQYVDDVEPAGWIRRDFVIPDPEEAYLWHCVFAEGRRLTLGFMRLSGE